MPVRSLNSSVFKWPDQRKIDKAVRAWVAEERECHPALLRLGYFGSYARNDWGVGSDLDLVAILDESSEPFERRNLSWNLGSLPVPAELLVYTRKEWDLLPERGEKFARVLTQETVWVYERIP